MEQSEATTEASEGCLGPTAPGGRARRLLGRTLAVGAALTLGLGTVGITASAAPRQDPVPTDPATTEPPPPPAPVEAPAPDPPPPAPPEDPNAKVLNQLVINLGAQHVYAIANDGTTLRDMPASTGRNGGTPRGTFYIFRRSQWTTATSNPRVSMQFMSNFNGGIGFHGIPRENGVPLSTPLGRQPVSHGCIRLADIDAFWIYYAVPMGTRVVVK